MYDAQDRYSLALGVLNGEQDTHKILADLLEEQGDRGLAQWARARKGKRTRRLDFVLAVLPYKTSLRLGCDFLEHAISRHKDARWLIDGLKQIRNWSISQGTGEELTAGCLVISQALPWSYGIRDFDRPAQALHAAAKCAEVAQSCQASGDAGRYRAHAAEATNGVRRVAKAARVLAASSNRVNDELSWQLTHVETVIEKLLQQSIG